MSIRLNREKIDLALREGLSVRQKARELDCSSITVRRIIAKYRDGGRDDEVAQEDRVRLKEDFLVAVLAEAFRLSRYPLEELVRIVEKSWVSPLLPKTDVLAGDKIPVHRLRRALRTTHGIRFYTKRNPKTRTVQSDSAQDDSIQKPEAKPVAPNMQRQRPQSGTYGIHRVRVKWRNPQGETCRADVLAVLERATGILVTRAYSRLHPNGVTRTLFDAYRLTRLPVARYAFVAEVSPPSKQKARRKEPTKEEDGKRVRRPRLSAACGESARTHQALLEQKWDISFTVEVEPPMGTITREPICLPWAFQDVNHLNRFLQQWTAAYNCGKLKPSFRSVAVRQQPSPVKVLFQYQDFVPGLEKDSLEVLTNRIGSYKRESRLHGASPVPVIDATEG